MTLSCEKTDFPGGAARCRDLNVTAYISVTFEKVAKV